MSKNYRWYVEPIDSMVNEMIARQIPDYENAQIGIHGVVLKNGIEMSANLWEVDYKFASQLYKICKRNSLFARFFVQKGNGKIREKPAITILSPKKPKIKIKKKFIPS